jgi:hypothetical protein
MFIYCRWIVMDTNEMILKSPPKKIPQNKSKKIL